MRASLEAQRLASLLISCSVTSKALCDWSGPDKTQKGFGLCSTKSMANQDSYLEYLDKEMIIMGVLSAFCVAAVGLFLKELGDATFITQMSPPSTDKPILFSILWLKASWYLMAGSACVLAAARLFYEQRSTLAFYYGQISLAMSPDGKQITSKGTKAWIEEADAWRSWLWYRLAFWCLGLGLFIYGFAFLLLHLRSKAHRSALLYVSPHQLMWLSIGVCIVWILAAVFSEVVVYRK
jgi:hypothetical protein